MWVDKETKMANFRLSRKNKKDLTFRSCHERGTMN